MKLKAADGRFRLTDIANRQTLLRIIQSVPSPKAESVRIWLAQVGEERLEEIEHPEAALERVRGIYRGKGYNDSWIEERLKNDLIRNELTDEWKIRGVQKGVEFAILTNTLSEGTFGISIQAHKRYKLLPTKTNLRDHMTPMELALCSISEATSITFHRKRESQGFPELKRDTVDAGSVGNQVRELIEKSIGESVVSQENYLDLKKVKSESQKGQLPVKKDKNLTLFDGLDSNQG
jgi:DNA-damage-inducible protein D